MRILVLSPISPLPIFTGGRQRLYQVTREQARRHQVTFLSFFRTPEEREGLAQLGRELGVRVIGVPFLSPKRVFGAGRGWQDLFRIAMGYFRVRRAGWPQDVAIWEQPGMHRALTAELAASSHDLLQVEWPYMAPYVMADLDIPTALITHDVFSVSLARRAELQKQDRARARLLEQARRWRAYEAMIYPRFSLVAAMSRADAAWIHERAPQARVILSPNGVDVRGIQPGDVRKQARHLLFVGSPTHEPNLDAACWLLTDIWPQLRARAPHLTLTLVNLDHPRVWTCAANAQAVRITGRVADVLPFYRQADIALAPIRAGSGTRLKILEAFAAGVPVISTTLGCEGLEVIPGQHVAIADDAAAFVAAVLALLEAPERRQALARAARALAEAQYDWVSIVDGLDEAYEAVLRQAYPGR